MSSASVLVGIHPDEAGRSVHHITDRQGKLAATFAAQAGRRQTARGTPRPPFSFLPASRMNAMSAAGDSSPSMAFAARRPPLGGKFDVKSVW